MKIELESKGLEANLEELEMLATEIINCIKDVENIAIIRDLRKEKSDFREIFESLVDASDDIHELQNRLRH